MKSTASVTPGVKKTKPLYGFQKIFWLSISMVFFSLKVSSVSSYEGLRRTQSPCGFPCHFSPILVLIWTSIYFLHHLILYNLSMHSISNNLVSMQHGKLIFHISIKALENSGPQHFFIKILFGRLKYLNGNESSQFQACPKAAACRIMLTMSLVLILDNWVFISQYTASWGRVLASMHTLQRVLVTSCSQPKSFLLFIYLWECKQDSASPDHWRFPLQVQHIMKHLSYPSCCLTDRFW